jgi:hypothetical protein
MTAPVSDEYVAQLATALKAADDAGNAADAYDLANALRDALKNTRTAIRAQRFPSEYNPDSPGFRKKYGATSSMNKGQLALAGAGKAYMDVGRGVKQLTGNMTREEVDALKAQDADLMRTGAGLAGNIGGNAAIALPSMFVPGANTYTGAALIGGGLGALQPVGTDDSRGLNTVLGAGGGMAGKFVGNRIANWAASPRQVALPGTAESAADASSAAGGAVSVGPSQAGAQTSVTGSVEASGRGGGYTFGHVGDDASAGLSAAQRDIMQRGQAIGMRTTPGQATGSRALQQLEAKLESQPMTSGPFNTIKANNARAINREWARAIGENADSLDSAVLDRAATRISGVFENAGDDVARPIEPQRFMQTYAGIQEEVRGLTKGFESHPLVEDLVAHAHGGQATGKQLQSLTSKLGKAAYKEMTTPSGDRDLGMALYQAKDYVDDLLLQGMSAERAARFQAARGQYRNLMLLTSRSSVLNPSTGTVNPRSLANVLQMKDKSGFTYGRNRTPAYDAVRFGQAFQPIVGDSGTATRMPLQGATDLLMRLGGNIASHAYASTPAVNMAMRTQAAANAAGRAVSPIVTPVSNAARAGLGPAPFYAPYYLPGFAGLMGPNLASE